MSGLNLEQALAELATYDLSNNEESRQLLRDLVARLDVDAGDGRTTVSLQVAQTL